MQKALLLISCWFLLQHPSRAQTIGGNSAFNFVKLPNAPQLTALGGINISAQSNDISMAFNNPALLRDSMNSQLNTVFNSFFGGISNYSAMVARHAESLHGNMAIGVNYFNYGKVAETDPSGNILGEFRPVDYVVQASFSQSFQEQWHYGVTFKFINSSYGPYKSNGVAADFGVTYSDVKNLLQVAFLAKNMGTQVKAYGTEKEDIPFDVQLGISKRLQNAPVQFSLAIHHLHQFDIRYNDTTFDATTGSSSGNNNKFTAEKVLLHLVGAVQVYFGDKVEITVGYNHLRRSELKISTAGNGLNGFSAGAGVLFSKLQVRYARSYYQNTKAYNQLGINIKLNDYFNFAK